MRAEETGIVITKKRQKRGILFVISEVPGYKEVERWSWGGGWKVFSQGTLDLFT